MIILIICVFEYFFVTQCNNTEIQKGNTDYLGRGPGKSFAEHCRSKMWGYEILPDTKYQLSNIKNESGFLGKHI